MGATEGELAVIRGRALDALQAIGRGEGKPAVVFLHGLASSGYDPAREAIAEVETGRWSRALIVLVVVCTDVDEDHWRAIASHPAEWWERRIFVSRSHSPAVAEWDRKVADAFARKLHDPQETRLFIAREYHWRTSVAVTKMPVMVPREMLEKAGFVGAELDAAEGAGLNLEDAVDRGVVKLPPFLTREQLRQYLKNLETVHAMGMTLEEWTDALDEVTGEGSAADIGRLGGDQR